MKTHTCVKAVAFYSTLTFTLSGLFPFSATAEDLKSTETTSVEYHLDAAAAAQEGMLAIGEATFSFHFEGDPHRIVTWDGVSGVDLGTKIDGKVSWYRGSNAERIDWEFLLPKSFPDGGLKPDSIRIYSGSGFETIIIPGTKQAARRASNHAGGRKPQDWLLPVFGETFAQLRAGGSTTFVKESSDENGAWIRAVRKLDDGTELATRAFLSRQHRYSITRASWDNGERTFEIDYSTDANGRQFPRRAVYKSFDKNGAQIERAELSLITSSWEVLPNESPLFSFLPSGGVLNDNRYDKSFRIGEDGIQLTEFKVIATANGRQARATRVGFSVVTLALGAFCLRMMLIRHC